jgi:uncharacterized membrane protein
VIDRLTLATSTGLPFLALAFHFATGLIALAAGFLALAVRKGGTWHRRSGLGFVLAMIATGITAAGISVVEGKSVNGGVLVVYLVLTGYTTVTPLRSVTRLVDIALMVLAFSLAASELASGLTALGMPGNQIGGVPAGMMFFMAAVVSAAAIGDLAMIRSGGVQGTRRLARHLWRMCFALFIASGSFFLGQMKFIPERIRIVPLIVVLGVTPLVALLYWIWRVRLRRNLRGIMSVKPGSLAVDALSP